MKVAIYARVSTGEQDYENQLIQLREFCRLSNYEIYHEYVDIMSGAKGEADRVNFKKMLLHASQRKFSMLLFWSLDRLTREGAVKTLNYLELLKSYQVTFKSYSEQYLDSTGIFQDAIIGILAAIAKQERIRISERVKAGIQRKRKDTAYLHGRPKLDLKLKELILKLRAEKLSLREIASQLNIGHSTVAKYLNH